MVGLCKSSTLYCSVSLFFLIDTNYLILGQNSLSLAAYSGDQLTCDELLRVWPYKNYNKTSMLTPLCVAIMREHIDLVRFFLTIDIVSSKATKCKTATVHGICPLKIAKDKENYELVELLMDVHKLHLD